MPSIREFKDKVIEIVVENRGIKADDLPQKLPMELLIFPPVPLIAEMVEKGEIGILNYTVPEVRNPIALLIPIGSEVLC